MSTYKPDVKMYYGPLDADHRFTPVPDISIGLSFQYSNDAIIGYVYTVTLTGFATARDLSSLEYGDIISNDYYLMGSVIDHIYRLRKLLSQNGNILSIVDGQTDSPILKAKGGILRSFSFDESPNNWQQSANYTATLEFQRVDFMSATEDCDTIFLDPSTYTNGTAGITDIDKYSIKSFEDNWSFTFDDNEAYNRVSNGLNINNSSFTIQYNISAVGKHLYDYSNETTNASTLLPAWEQAKNFVQYRLYYQVTNLINGVLKNTYTSGCSGGESQTNLNNPGASSNGLMSGVGDALFKIFNEQITCESSESAGSFSATYSAVVKGVYGNPIWSTNETKHTVTKSERSTTNSNATNKSISLNGTIEGLIEGGIIRTSGPINLPSTGSLLIYTGNLNSRYNNAKALLDKIYSASDYNNGIGTNGKRDLKPAYKNALGITSTSLDKPPSPSDTRSDPPHPTSFNLTHDYISGTINYSVEYSNVSSCTKQYQQISIQTTNPTKVIASFNIPGANSCPTIQELGTYTAKRISVTIQGSDTSDTGKPENIVLRNLIQCGTCGDDGYFPVPLPPPGNYIITQKQYTFNPIDGSYTINLGYICDNSGCTI
jgi:hypothetical protein